jgi:hypothetical protein
MTNAIRFKAIRLTVTSLAMFVATTVVLTPLVIL